MSYTAYKFLHIASIIFIFLTLGGLTVLSAKTKSRKIFMAINGICLLIAFVAGFGLIARLEIQWPWPLWLWVKLLGWLLVGMGPSFAKKLSPANVLLMYGFIAVVLAYMALFKPF